MNRIALFVATALFLTMNSLAASPTAQSTAFTYQGNLNASGSAASGTFDLTFKLFDANIGGTQVGSTISLPQYPIANGVFTADLNFPGAFTGTQLWLEVTVGTQTLSPRQPVNSVPVAEFALSGNVGPPGPSGLRGYTSLIGLTPEFPGNNCIVGGSKITAGADLNGNGVLDPGEVTATSYLCNVTSPTLPPQCTASPLSWGPTAIDFTWTDPDPNNNSPLPNTGSFITLTAHPVDTNTCGTLPLTPYSYAWSLFSAPTGSNAVLSSSTDATPAFIPDLPGTYVFQANVKDAVGNRTPSRYLSLKTSTCGASRVTVSMDSNVSQYFSATPLSDDNDLTKCPLRFQESFKYSWSVLSAPLPSTWQFSAPTLAGTLFLPSGPGSYTVAVNLSGSNGQAGSGMFTINFGQKTSTTTLTSNLNPSTLGQSVMFIAHPDWDGQAPYFTLLPPTGSVTFLDGANNITGCIAIPLSTSGTQALCTTSALTSGAHSITAAYSGDFIYKPSTSPVLTQTVN